MRSFWQPHPTQDQPTTPEGFEIDSRIDVGTPRAPAVSKEDSCPQAILKFHRPSSLDYRDRHKLMVKCKSSSKFVVAKLVFLKVCVCSYTNCTHANQVIVAYHIQIASGHT